MRWKHLLFIAGITGFNIVIDQVSKIWAIATFQGKEAWRFLGDLVVLTYAENTGAFLSFLADGPEWIRFFGLIALPLAACVAGLVYLLVSSYHPEPGLLKISLFNRNLEIKAGSFTVPQYIALASALGGGISNLVDRFRFGYVVDFLNFGIGPVVRTGILNVADLSLTFGLIIYLILARKSRAKP